MMFLKFILGIYGAFPDQHITVTQDPKIVDMLDIPGKGRCYVYIARYVNIKILFTLACRSKKS